MKRFIYKNIKIIGLIVALIMCFSFVACSQEEPEPTASPTTKATVKPTPTPTPIPETSMTKIQGRGYLIVACEPAAPPYVYMKKINSEYQMFGAEYELVKKLAEQLDVQLIVKNVKQSDIVVGVQTGLYDIGLSNNTLTVVETLEVDLTQQYFISEYPVITNKVFEDTIKTLDDFKDERMGIMKGSVENQLIREKSHKYTRYKVYTTESTMIDNLVTGTYLRGVCLDAYKARYYLNKFPDLTYLEGVVLVPDNAKGRAIAVSLEKDDLLTYVNDSIDSLTHDKFLLTKLGISVTDYAKNTIEIDSACTDYVGILYGK